MLKEAQVDNSHIEVAKANGFSPLLTINEVAKILRMSLQCAKQLEHRPENPLKLIKLSPRRVYVRREDFEEFLVNSGMAAEKPRAEVSVETEAKVETPVETEAEVVDEVPVEVETEAEAQVEAEAEAETEAVTDAGSAEVLAPAITANTTVAGTVQTA